MKYAPFLRALLGSVPAIAGERWRNALKPAGESATQLTLVENGQPVYSIFLPADAPAPAPKAAEDLGQWIAEMTGAAARRR